MTKAEAVFTATGTPATRGTCPECGTGLFRMGRTPEHEGLTPPVIQPKKKAQKTTPRRGRLVIVESPAKARTVARYLGKGYTVRASVGHVRDLLRSKLSVDVENNFEPSYRVPNDKREVVKDIKEAAKKAKEIYLATDPDREGEAIAWHLLEAAELEPELTKRVVFHEITKSAVETAFEHPRALDMNLVDAQQARRVLDRLVGYNLSPILWRKVRGRLSAGRVQSVALKIIVDREREIDSFTQEEFWVITGEFLPEGFSNDNFLKAKLVKVNKENPVLPNEATTNALVLNLKQAEYKIGNVKKSERQRKPSPPFITSTLQQEASRKLGYTAKRTMALAQQLYEGIEVGGEGLTGLITYMRTDSTNVSPVAQLEAREYVKNRFGEKFLPSKSPNYKTKTKGAQEAHEAIRPTSVMRDPGAVKDTLKRDQYRLYRLIWQRFVASQMAKAIYDTVAVTVKGQFQADTYQFKATGSILQFQGFLILYEEGKDDDPAAENGNGSKIPEGLVKHQDLDLLKLYPEQRFTQPPPRYTEASLVRTLEEFMIGRPSTYAPTLSTIQQRGYVYREKKTLFPTETGIVVNDLLANYFPNILAVDFTARMEGALDKVASGDEEWTKLIADFYKPFEESVQIANDEMPEVKVEQEFIGRQCPECGKELLIRWGRFGKFVSCSGFPTCKYTEPWLEKINITCPKCGGDLVSRKSRKGRTFYGCANYPTCDFVSWKRPSPVKCPDCGGLQVIVNRTTLECMDCNKQHSNTGEESFEG